MSYFKVRNPYDQKQFLVTGASDVLASNSQGQSYESAFTIQDSSPASSTNLWSSAKILASTLSPVSPATAGDLASLTAGGQVQDASVKVDDLAPPSTSVLFTSSKNATLFQSFISPFVTGHLASIDGAGQTKDSGIVVDDALPAATDVLYSSAKLLSLLSRVFVRGNFDAVTVPNVTLVTLAGTPTQNIGGGWSGSTFTSPRDAYYVVGFSMQSDSTAGAAVNSYWEGICRSSASERFSNVTNYGSAIPVLTASVAASGAFFLLSGQTIHFRLNNHTGFAQSLISNDYNTFYIVQVY